MRLSLIVAMAQNRVIGRDGQLPWHLSADLRRFKRITMGHHLIMGRRTYESLGRPLPGRTTVVISRTAELDQPAVTTVRTLEEALAVAAGDNEPFVIGGGQIFERALPSVDRLYTTIVHAEVDGDVYFPPVDWSAWSLVQEERHQADDRNDHDYSFRVYDRVLPIA